MSAPRERFGMPDSAPSVLSAWANFCIMTGSSAAALTGLMFVVITLVTGEERPSSRDGISVFSTPTVVHFCAALLVSAVLSAPWRSLVPVAALLGLAGLYGVLYVLRVLHLTRRQSAYKPDMEDWVWYTVLPFAAYGAILAGAIALLAFPREALFSLASGVMVLIFIGIRNAWDIVTFLATGGPNRQPGSAQDDQAEKATGELQA
jgi:hypothetical protein